MTSLSNGLTTALVKPMRLDSAAFGRFYQIEGLAEPVPSVTHVLSCLGKPALINWAASEERKLIVDAAADLYQDAHGTPLMLRAAYTDTLLKRVTKVKAHQKQLAKAGEIGTQVHHRVEWQLRKDAGQLVGPEPPLSPDAVVAYTKFQDWALRGKLRPVYLEQTVWSVKYQYAGTLDFFGYLDKVPVICDWKTSSAIFPEYHTQVAAYWQALREMKIANAKRAYIVRFPKKVGEEMEVQEVEHLHERFLEFLKIRKMFDVWYTWEEAYQKKREAEKAARGAA